MNKQNDNRTSRGDDDDADAFDEFEEITKVDWQPLFKTLRQAFDWALNVAAALARDFPEDVEAVERVREFMRARLAGKPAMVSIEDVLFTFGLVIGAIERDLGHTHVGSPWLAPPSRMHFPSGSDSGLALPRILLAHALRARSGSPHPFI